MSGFQTHMLIGGVAGLALGQALVQGLHDSSLEGWVLI